MSTRKIFYFCLLFLVSHVCSFCQVNLQTGSAVFSLPMFNWQDDKSRLTSVVALNYNSGNGLKVNDVASNVGQGWNLISGGVITRMQVGEPDDQPAFEGAAIPTGHPWQPFISSGSDQNITKFPAGYLYGTIPASQGCPNALTKYPTYGSQNTFYALHNSTAQDRQLDYFSFQFNGKSGMFILDTTGGDHGVPLGDTKMKISFQRDPTMISQGIRTTITSFTITDVDGLIYKFTLHGLTKLLKESFSNEDGTKIRTQPPIKDLGIYCQSAFDVGPTSTSNLNNAGLPSWGNQYMVFPYIISNWYLSEIDDPFTARKIIFNYNQLNLTNSAGQEISYNNSSNRYIVISYKKSITTTQEISSITYPDGHVVSFTYSSSRFDYPGQSPLSRVDITYNGRYLSEYQLNTTYFILNHLGIPTSTYEQSVARLCLRSVKKIGVDLKEDTPPYTFDYYTGSNNADDFVPPPFFYAKDIWGFYNGNNSILSNSPLSQNTTPVSLTTSVPYYLGFNSLKGLCFLNDNVSGIYYNAKSGYAQNGLLKQITYPTGGSLTYQYSQNSGSFAGSSTLQTLGGVSVSQTNSSDGYSAACNTPVSTHYNYVMNGTGSASSLWGIETPVNSLANNNFWQEERKTLHWHWYSPFPTCLWHYIYPGIVSQLQATNINSFQQFMIAIAPVLGILSTISTINDISALLTATTFGTVIAVVLDVAAFVLDLVFSCPYHSKNIQNVTYYNFDLNQIAPLPAQFKRVEITESTGTIGKTVQQFTNGDDDYLLWDDPGNNIAFSAKQRFAPWAYGLPKLTTVYDVNGNKIKETENDYDFSYAQETINAGQPCFQRYSKSSYLIPQTPLSSCKCAIINNNSLRSDVWANPAWYDLTYVQQPGNSDMNVDIYNMSTGRVLLSNTYERTYKISDPTQYVQTETDYYYNSPSFIPFNNTGQCTNNNYDVRQIVTTQSNGDVNYKNINYPYDYNTGVLAILVQKNILSIPVATNTYVIKSGSGTSPYLNEKVTEFTQLPNGDIKPSRILEQRFATPNQSFTPYSGPTTTNYSLYKIPQQFTYDANNNLIGLKDEGGRAVSNIYDYNDKYIVASVINADPATDTIAYSSFETNDLSRSGWILSGTASYSGNNLAPTGNNTFTLLPSGANRLTSSGTLNQAKYYIVSFWANNSNVSVWGGASLIKSGPAYSGFTYYEYSVLQGSTPNITIINSTSSNISIDELRLYPSTARMRTTTYDPLIGKTSECDENNRITYYAYDNLGRMRFIEDENKNIVKMYEYNNISPGKQISCPVTFFNRLFSEYFSRSNCSSGYQGSSVNYSIPANQFSSAASQWDADIQAEIYLLTNGQNFANTNGSCSLIYHNTVQSETDSAQSCGPGYKGGFATYTVPANTYNSIISQSDANQQALDDIAANAKAYANDPLNAVCVIDTAADWEWNAGDASTPADPSYCLTVNGQLPAHLFQLFTDLNPNSPTYNHKMWEDDGPSDVCGATQYYNASQSKTFTRNNCSAGNTGGSVTYTVGPGTYGSFVSQALANQLATNDINTNGQAYANTNGTCISNCSFTPASGLSIPTSGISNSGGSVSFFIVFVPTRAFNLNSTYTIATINGGCKPSGTRTFTTTYANRTWNVSISASGQLSVQLTSGPVLAINSGTEISGSYNP